MTAEEEFCPHCGVTLDLHSGPDTCELADAKAWLLEMFGGLA